MRAFKKSPIIIAIFIIMTIVLSGFKAKGIINNNVNSRRIVKVGVLVYNDNVFSYSVAKSLKDIEKEKGNEIQFTLFDGKSTPSLESRFLKDMINNNYDLILINIGGETVPQLIEDSVQKAKQKKIPLIFFEVTPVKLDAIKSYSKALIINNDSKQGGTLQGKMIADAWNVNKDIIDKNRDNILQYIMLQGNPESFATQERTKYSIKTINDEGIQTQKLASVNANWEQELAKIQVESLYLRYGSKIEVIIANNDSMAIGAVKALQRYGYNMGNKAKNIPVFGINTSPEAEELIKEGFMAGIVNRSPFAFAETLYTVGMNLVNNKNPLEGTNYKFNETGVTILLPFEGYTSQNGK